MLRQGPTTIIETFQYHYCGGCEYRCNYREGCQGCAHDRAGEGNLKITVNGKPVRSIGADGITPQWCPFLQDDLVKKAKA